MVTQLETYFSNYLLILENIKTSVLCQDLELRIRMLQLLHENQVMRIKMSS